MNDGFNPTQLARKDLDRLNQLYTPQRTITSKTTDFGP
jgi:hypothetical protein